MTDIISNAFAFIVLAPIMLACCIFNIDENKFRKNLDHAYIWTESFIFLVATGLVISFQNCDMIYGTFLFVPLAINDISVYFSELVAILFLLSSLIAYNEPIADPKKNIIGLAFLESALFLFFNTNDIAAFFILLELISLPIITFLNQTIIVYCMFIVSGLALFSMAYITGITNIYEISILLKYTFNLHEERIIFVLFFSTFIFKSVVLPMYFWIKRITATIPTYLSIILYGVIFNTGTYGIITVLQKISPMICYEMQNIIYVFALGLIIYSMIFIFRKFEIEKNAIPGIFIFLTAFELIGAFSQNIYGVMGTIFCSIFFGVALPTLMLVNEILENKNREKFKLLTSNSSKKSASQALILIFPLAVLTFSPILPSFLGIFLVLYSCLIKNLVLSVLLSLVIAINTFHLFQYFSKYFLHEITSDLISVSKSQYACFILTCGIFSVLSFYSADLCDSIRLYLQNNLTPYMDASHG